MKKEFSSVVSEAEERDSAVALLCGSVLRGSVLPQQPFCSDLKPATELRPARHISCRAVQAEHMANYNSHLLKCHKYSLKAVLSLWFTVLALSADKAVNGCFWRNPFIPNDDGKGWSLVWAANVFPAWPVQWLGSECCHYSVLVTSFPFLPSPSHAEPRSCRKKCRTEVSERR